MNSKSLSIKNNAETQGATVFGPGDFAIGSPESRAAARFRLQGFSVRGEVSSACLCFPEDEQPFFCSPSEEQVAARVKCPLHGSRFRQPISHICVSAWLVAKQPARRQQGSPQPGRRGLLVSHSMVRNGLGKNAESE
jgi:hypothetical protein